MTTAPSARAPESGVVVRSPHYPDGSTREVTVASQLAGTADLVLEGGGVKGLGLVGAALALSDAGYRFNRVAGASAGAIVAALLAALQAAQRPVAELERILSTIRYDQFVADRPLGTISEAVRLLTRKGLHNGKYLQAWLGEQLDALGVRTFGDLRLDDPELEPARRFGLVVVVSDVTRGKSVRLPWDYAEYGLDPDRQSIVDAVRASVAIPFFFTPSRTKAKPARLAGVDFPAGTCTWVDGGLLDNFPVDVFGRPDGTPGRWPTIGVKLSTNGPPAAHPSDGLVAEAKACLETLLDNADRFYVMPADAQRTIFVDHGDIQTTDFGITAAQQQQLLANGRLAAEAFLRNRPVEEPSDVSR